MTFQVRQGVSIEQRHFHLLGVRGTGFFDPRNVDINPYAFDSACWRGFVCSYLVDDRCLFLSHLEVGVSPKDRVGMDDELPLGDEVLSARNGELRYYGRDLRYPVSFTGRLLVGTDSIDDRGLLPIAWDYSVVWEIEFETGRLSRIQDLSAELAEQRRKNPTCYDVTAKNFGYDIMM